MTADEETVEAFIARWASSSGSERSNYQLFLNELCGVLDVEGPRPSKADVSQNAYVFERRVPFRRLEGKDTHNYIDLYKRGCFVLEAKQSAKRLKRFTELKQLGFDLP